jgi:hypothetical protein
LVKVKILSLGDPERYAVRRMVTAAQFELQTKFPGLELDIQEIGDPSGIGKYALVLVLPTLVINEIVVCTGRFPSRDEIVAWLCAAVESA